MPWLNKREESREASLLRTSRPTGRCSAFIATGSYTKGGKIVIAHNNWSSYAEGERWTIMFDIQPEHGHRILMDGVPGVITSQDDFGVNDAGHDDHRDNDYAVRRLESGRQAGVRALAQGAAICQLD